VLIAVSVGGLSSKPAVKMHTLLDLRGSIPDFIHVSEGKMCDALALDLIAPEAGSIYVMDRGYVDFCALRHSHRRALQTALTS
jgi:hypothetical protein